MFVFHDNANAFEKINFLGGEKKRIPNTKKAITMSSPAQHKRLVEYI